MSVTNKKYKAYFAKAMILMMALIIHACNYLDVIPDNIATIENAFAMRAEAEKYLYTCYSYMPRDGDLSTDPSIFGGDELWSVINPPSPQFNDAVFRIARGLQNSTSPLMGGYWADLYRAIRTCNIFLENVDKVPDLGAMEKEKWRSEVLFLKAYYHFYLVRMYGPIPLIRKNLPIDAGSDVVKVFREPVDSCFNYIVSLIDEAIPGLEPIIINQTRELGRITKPIAAAWKAKVLVTAASPLFNGNRDQETLRNRGSNQSLFNTVYDAAKWEAAVTACKEAIDMCHGTGIKLYRYNPDYQQYMLSDTTMMELTVRNTFCEKWNSEIIWANTQTDQGTMNTLQRLATANLDSRYTDNPSLRAHLQPPLKIAGMFYTDHGVPVNEDKERQNVDPYALRTGTDKEQLYIKNGYTTAELNFNREPRFYATLGFDGGIWYGQGKYENKPDDMFWVACRMDGAQKKLNAQFGPFTGYYWKKCVHYQNVQTSATGYTMQYYPWTIMRLADLYLLYAEAVNEVEGVSGPNRNEMFACIDLVRVRAGLQGVQASWDTYTDNKKYETQNGMRQIIRQERMIELALEGQRFWDMRRWKTAMEEFGAVEGFRVYESAPEKYYQPTLMFKQIFNVRDYFWPIQDSYIENNPNLVQNIGW